MTSASSRVGKARTTSKSIKADDYYNLFEGDYSITSPNKRQKVTLEDYPEEARDNYVEIDGKIYNKLSLPPHYLNYRNGLKIGSAISIQSFRDDSPSTKGDDNRDA